MKWRSASGVFYDHIISIKLMGKFFKIATKLVTLYVTKCWAIKKQPVHKMSVIEMRILGWISGNTRKDMI